MNARIIALKCPLCGGDVQIQEGQARFGSELVCNDCGARSLLIIDNSLVTRASLEASGGRICVECGRVARGEARFCQCGASLVRTCYWCYREVPVNHPRCDICGWLDPGFGVVPAIEGRWRTFLSLLPDMVDAMGNFYDERRGSYISLFKSVWDDPNAGSAYHLRYEEILANWKYDWPSNEDDREYIYATAILFFDHVFAKTGQPLIDSLVRIALQADERATRVVVLLRHLAGESRIDSRCSCSLGARGALVALVANRAAAASVRGEAANSLGKIYAKRELVALAAGQDSQAAMLSMAVLERVALGCCYSGDEDIATLKRCSNRDIAARAKALAKKIDRR
jgi:hypothetical protein